MSESTEKTEVTAVAPREVLFFELEYIATDGRQAMFDVLKQTLKSKNVDVTPAAFSRSAVAVRPAQAIQAMVDAAGKSPADIEKLKDQAESSMHASLVGDAKLNKAFPALVEESRKRNIEVVAVSPQSKEVAGELMKKLGLEEMGVKLEAFGCSDTAFPRADHWLRMIKNRKQEALPLIALVSSHVACKGALTAGAVCVAVPDAYTSFEDFAGAQLVLDSLDEVSAKEILDAVSRR